MFINASWNRFQRKFCSYKKRTFDGRLLLWQYVVRSWLIETSENQQIKRRHAVLKRSSLIYCVVVRVKTVTRHANHAERQNGTLSKVDRP